MRPGAGLARRLSRDDVTVAARTALLVVRVRVLLRLGGLPRASAALGLEATGQLDLDAGPALLAADWRRAHVARRVLGLPMLRTTCLPAHLALAEVLRRPGLLPDVVIGVRGAGEDGVGNFAAHAWVEVGGRRFDLAGYAPAEHRVISRLRSAGARRDRRVPIG